MFETELGLRSYLRVESSGLANNDLYVYFDDLTTLENAIETLKKLRVLMASKKEGEVRDGSTTVA